MTNPGERVQDRLGGPQPSISLIVLIVVVSGIGIGAVAYFLLGNGGDTSPPTAQPSTSTPSTWSETVTATATETITKTTVPASPSVTATLSEPIRTAPATSRPNTYTSRATIIGTCDEGGSCGVRQRTSPYTDAPTLYPSALKDGMTVVVTCQTIGDTRSNRGVGSSNVWYRLDTGVYVSSVYMTAVSWVPVC